MLKKKLSTRKKLYTVVEKKIIIMYTNKTQRTLRNDSVQNNPTKENCNCSNIYLFSNHSRTNGVAPLFT